MGKVSSLTLRPESSHRSNINGSRNTRGNDAILHEYYYIKVSNTIEKKKKRKLKEKKKMKKKWKTSCQQNFHACHSVSSATETNDRPREIVILILG